MAITNALWITLIGMSLVFFSILLLWGLMVLLVRVLADHDTPEKEPAAPAADLGQTSIPEHSLLLARKRRAAAVAVAAALAMAQDQRKLPAPGTAIRPPGVSTWQAVNRAGLLGQQSYASRKKVVR